MRKLILGNVFGRGQSFRNLVFETKSPPKIPAHAGSINTTSKFSTAIPSSRQTIFSSSHNQHVLDSRDHVHHRRLATTVAAAAASSSSSASALSAIRSRRSALFDAEAERQKSLASSRIEKIRIEYETDEKKVELWMNKDLSTPHDCAMHLKTLLTRQR